MEDDRVQEGQEPAEEQIPRGETSRYVRRSARLPRLTDPDAEPKPRAPVEDVDEHTDASSTSSADTPPPKLEELLTSVKEDAVAAEPDTEESGRSLEVVADGPEEAADPEELDVMIDLRRSGVGEGKSRYEFRSGSLPHLSDDPYWRPLGTGMPKPVEETPKSVVERLLRLAGLR